MGLLNLEENKIIINNLKIFGYHGATLNEQKNGQNFLLSFVLIFNFDRAIFTDSLNETLNYDFFCEFISKIFNENKFKLLETLANFLAEQILLNFKILHAVKVVVHKQNAPFVSINKPSCVKIELSLKWHLVYLSLGSNLNNKLKNIQTAINLIKQEYGVCFLKCSSIIETVAYGAKMPNFLNCAIELKTFLNPIKLLQICNSIEIKLKRVRTKKWAPRTIDVDILFYDDIVFNTKKLTIPHYDIKNRNFVLNPLLELNPNLMHPVFKKTIAELHKNLNKN